MRTRHPQPELPFRQLGDPLYSQRNPHQLFLLALSILSAIGLIQGATGSAVLDDALDDRHVTMWGLCLLIGSVTGLIGMWWPRTWTGLVIERAGLAVVGSAATIYSVLVFKEAPAASFTAFIHVAFALSCFWRVWQISSRLRWVRRQVARVNQEGS